MRKTILGIVTTTIVLYLWGFLYWGVSTLPYTAWKQTANDSEAQIALRKHFPESGTYFIPGMYNDAEALEKLYMQGPVGFVHIQLEGRPAADTTIMITGFLLNLTIVALLAGFFHIAKAAEFRDFARLSLAAGAVAVVMIDGGHIVWWQEPPNWVIWQAIYNFSGWLIAGHLLGVFMKKPRQESE